MTQPILGNPSKSAGDLSGAENAARLLCAPGGPMRLSLDEAHAVVRYMSPRFMPSGTTFIKEGDEGDGGFMAMAALWRWSSKAKW
jgi:hypothetical protein